MWIGRGLVPSAVRDYFRDIQLRMAALETAVDVLLKDGFQFSPENAFNGQDVRKRIVDWIIGNIAFDLFVETGTWMGDTLGYVATRYKLRSVSCETNRTYHALATRRLSGLENVDALLVDSRAFLDSLRDSSSGKTLLVYLDAHWSSDLPLLSELAIVGHYDARVVVLIDDFAVPGDSGYGYDSYGRTVLNMDLIERVCISAGFGAFFPKVASREETGRRRGCVVLGKGAGIIETLSRCPLIGAHGP